VTVHNTFTCDYCNPSMAPDHDGGVAITVGHRRPERWWEVPKKGPNESVGHACPECVATNGEAQRDIAERRDAALMEMAGIRDSEIPELPSEDQGAGDRPNG
jgi:hypothetical protein